MDTFLGWMERCADVLAFLIVSSVIGLILLQVCGLVFEHWQLITVMAGCIFLFVMAVYVVIWACQRVNRVTQREPRRES